MKDPSLDTGEVVTDRWIVYMGDPTPNGSKETGAR